MTRLSRLPASLFAVLALASISQPSSAAVRSRPAPPIEERALQALEWRSIGPYRGGRVTAVAGVPGEPLTYYFGATGGGVWKTSDAGVTWRNVSDHWLGTGSVGALAVSESDPNVVYAGMGESCIRGNVSHGDGVYRSTDAGQTWTHLGLADTRQIGRIRVHPRDPERVYVAALGHTFGPNATRGIYRSLDGGRSWRQVLAVNERAGAVDLAMEPGNPRILYASFWEAQRTPWSLTSGGPGSGLYKSTDGGDTWRRLAEGGLPKGPWGRVGVSVAPSRPGRVWALIEAAEGGLFRSDDGGRTWRRTSEDRRLRQRAWYYSHVHADPENEDALWVLNVELLRSIDGGRTFTPVAAPHGDHHDLWIAPGDARRMINGNDGGANVSFDGGASWSRQDNQPTGQFYHVAVDDQFPYHMYGAQQDNSTIAIASRTSGAGIGPANAYPVGGCESGFVAPKTGQPHIVYAGCYGGTITRYDHRTRTIRNVTVHPDNPMGWGAEGMKHRFQWTFPILVSRHDPNTVYAAGNRLFRSRDEGDSWAAISPDLTRNDPTKLGPSGGPITKDNTSVEYYCTIFALAESPVSAEVLWTGSDDGRVHVSRDAGKSWSDITPRDLPPWTLVNQIDASPHQPGTAWVAATRYKLDDYRPYVFATHDYGRSWKRLGDGLPEMAFVRVVREDPVRPGLLYAGTEQGVFVSLDSGRRWQPLRMQAPVGEKSEAESETPSRLLPVVPITDLVVKDHDVVVSTQGRGFWVLDDVSPLRQQPAAAPRAAHLFTPAPAVRFGGSMGAAGRTGLNPPYGAVLYYHLARSAAAADEVSLEILDMAGKSIRRFSSNPERDSAGVQPSEGDGGGTQPAPPRVATRAGLNRFVWDLRHAEARRFPGMVLWGGGLQGPLAVPGRYAVKLQAGGVSRVDTLELRGDPRLSHPPGDDRAKFDLLTAIRDWLDETHAAIVRLRQARDQVKAAAERARDSDPDSTIARAARDLTRRLTAVEEALYQTRNRSSQDPLNYPIRLNNKLSALAGVVSGTEGRPTTQQAEVYRELSSQIGKELETLDRLLGEDVAALNRLMREREVPSVVVKAPARGRTPLP